MEDLDLPQVLAQAREILKNFTGSMEQAAVAALPPCCTPREIDTQTRCYVCEGLNHRACDCLLQRETSRKADAKLQTCMLTVGRSTLKSCGVGVVELSMGTMLPITVEVLIVDGELLGFDLLLGLDAIKLLGGMSLTSTGKVKFPRCDKPTCAAITTNEPDFSAEYDETNWRWTASWKWAGDQPPVMLKNRLSEHPASAQIQKEYDWELKVRIDNGWMLPYPEDELGPPKGCDPSHGHSTRKNRSFGPSWTTVSMWTHIWSAQMFACKS